jgi:hypothetical protein
VPGVRATLSISSRTLSTWSAASRARSSTCSTFWSTRSPMSRALSPMFFALCATLKPRIWHTPSTVIAADCHLGGGG